MNLSGIITAALAAIAVAGCAQRPSGEEAAQLRTGDLIFVGIPADYSLDSDSMASAIGEATGEADSLNIIHVAIAEVRQDSVWIIDATIAHGVDRHPLDTFLTDAHEITVGADLGYGFAPRPVRSFLFSVGAEYNLMQLLQVRAGYHYGKDRSILPSFASVGVGARFLHLRLDFAYLIAPESSLMYNTYSISFGFDF